MESVETPPFWQPSATVTWRCRSRRSAPILHSSLILILLPCLSLIIFLFIVVPSIPKFIPQNIDNKSNNTPTSFPIKKSWQSLNVVLVVFAILCGVFARRNDDVSTPENHHLHHHRREERIKSGDQINAGSQQWYGYSEQRISSPLTPLTGISRLRRTVSELPPAQDFQWETGNDKLRFFDDFDVSKYYPATPSHVIQHHYHHVIPEINQTEPEIDEPEVKEIPVDNFVLETRGELPSPTISPPPTPPPRSPAPPPPPPPPRQMSNKKPKRTSQNLPRTPPPPPPPPPSMGAPYGGWREKKRRSSRKRINATKEIANAIASLYNNNKRKRKLKSRQSYEDPLVVESESPATPTPPPPPPLPPPPSIFHSLFKKGSKTKKIHSLSSIPYPPPLPSRKPINSAGKPPLPTNSENQSPLITPPPPPLFKVAEMKFVMRGSREVEEVDGREMNGEDEEREGKDGPSMTCPSPDVNAKADNFIARLHDGWRLEKLNSWREKHQGGPRPIV